MQPERGLLPFGLKASNILMDRTAQALEVSRPLLPGSPQTLLLGRPRARAKFLFVGDRKLYVRGVTYGTFKPDEDGNEYPAYEVVRRDFAQMVANGINAVRTYTPPPRWVLDLAAQSGLYVMVGLALERYVGYLIDTKDAPDLVAQTRARVRADAGHPAILCYSIANEIPAPTVRWLGRKRVERFLRSICRAIKAEDPEALVTYVNYPSTEYLDLPFLDLASFNVFLETRETFDSYLSRLHSLAGDKPVLMGEIGLDAVRNSEARQAEVLDWQVRTAFAAECAGVFIYSWTDEWHRGGEEVYDWQFGLTRRDRSPKLALAAVRVAFAETPFSRQRRWPRISVVVCSCNGSRTIRETLEELEHLEYPDFEVIVIDDGSVDATAAIASAFNFRLIRTPNQGLGAARNVGAKAATGEIVAYIDDDAYPDPHWLHYLAAQFESGDWAGVGGPNLAPPGDGVIAACVANSPGGPVHVLISDREAEHIPGCNMAFRKSALEAVGGFDPQFRVAGDDVDVCWKLLESGQKIGFSNAAVVWHHRRNSIRAYWKQQCGYGKAEALLEQKWSGKYNILGHASWAGRVYGKGRVPILGAVSRVYHGIWGSAPFQVLYQRSQGTLQALIQMPEWYLISLVLALISGAGILWWPLLLAVPFTAMALAAIIIQAVLGAARVHFEAPEDGFRRRLLTAFLYAMQPLARLWGRIRYGLSPWRWRAGWGWVFPRTVDTRDWTNHWRSADDRIRAVEAILRSRGMFVQHGGDFDAWELEVRAGILGAARTLLAVEEQGGGCQMVRFRVWPRFSKAASVLTLSLTGLAIGAAFDGANEAAVVLGLVATILGGRILAEACASMSALLGAIRKSG
jgi:O-antigen biosynthesis protein